MKTNRHIGGDFDAFLAEEGQLDGARSVAARRVFVLVIEREMKRQGVSKSGMVARMRTSRAALDRLLDPNNSAVTLRTMERTASALGRRLKIELV